ncbi:MAG: UDP-N-acetylglucosamine 2-epimerase, partial [Candidatus Firestonebacteria bacterium]
MKKIAVITGTRAEYGLLQPLLKVIRQQKFFKLQIIATGMHLSSEFGLTYRQIEQDGFNISEKVEILLSSDTAQGITKSTGLGLIGFADAFKRLRPDMMIVLGDRFES